MIALYIFGTSGALLVLLLGLKGIERKRERRFFENARDTLDRWVEAAALLLLGTLPRRIRASVSAIVTASMQRVSVLLLKLVRRIEYRLSAMVQGLRGKRRIQKRQRPMSSFIETVSAHKVNGTRNTASRTVADGAEDTE
jgi:predicted membrane chloride channel (bestrophin family)